MTDAPRYAGKGERDRLRARKPSPLIVAWINACDYLQAKLDESVARAIANEAAISSHALRWATCSCPGPTCPIADDPSDAARELLEKARKWDEREVQGYPSHYVSGHPKTCAEIDRERDSYREDAELASQRAVEIHALQRENAALREKLTEIRNQHGTLEQCTDSECGVCSVLECPDGDPLHYHHDGCPSEYVAEQRAQLDAKEPSDG